MRDRFVPDNRLAPQPARAALSRCVQCAPMNAPRDPPDPSPSMRVLGVDLASDPARTGLAVVRFTTTEATVETLVLGADDDAILAHHAHCDATGIDAPFGWPLAFADFVAAHARPTTPPADPGPWTTPHRTALRFRRTDHVARAITGRWPLSASSDLVAVPTFRCLGLLARMGVTDRAGDGRVFETYPALALRRWDLTAIGYKGRDRQSRLSALVDALLARAPWLHLDPIADRLVRTVDDTFDALIAALIAAAAHRGLTTPPDPTDRAAAAAEGWIIIPHPDALDHLTQPRGTR